MTEDSADAFQALSDVNRRQILRLLTTQRCSVNEIAQ